MTDSGRRTGKAISGSTTNYLYDGANGVQELCGTTVTVNLLSGGIDEVFMRIDSNGAANQTGGGVPQARVVLHCVDENANTAATSDNQRNFALKISSPKNTA